jgi:hypothetical protein
MNPFQPQPYKPKNSAQLLNRFDAKITLNLDPKLIFNRGLLLGQGIRELDQIGGFHYRVGVQATVGRQQRC